MRRLLAFVLLLVPIGAHAAPDVSFDAQVTPVAVRFGDPVELRVQAQVGESSGRREYVPPDLSAFDVLQFSPQQSTDWTIDPLRGQRVHRTELYRYVLRPKRKGSLRIGAAKLIVGGRTYATRPLTVEVVERSATPAAPQPPVAETPRESDEVFLDVVAEPKTVFVGQEIVVTWYLYTQSEVLKYRALTEPKTDGFWVEQLYAPTSRLLYERALVRGKEYSVATLLKRALFPLQTGKLTIGPMESEVTTFSSAFYAAGGASRKTPPLGIDVLPLPPGAPDGFDRANVGHFELDASLDRNRVAAGEPVSLKVAVSGQGNLRNVKLRPLPAVEGCKVYEPKIVDQIEPGERVQGKKIWEYLLVPERAGTVDVPRAELAFFDPAAKHYASARAPALSLTVLGTVPQAGAAAGPAENVLAPAIRNLRLPKSLHTRTAATLYRRRIVGPLLVLPAGLYFALVLGGRLRSRLRRETPRARLRRARGRARRRFRAAEQHLRTNRPAAFYGEIARVLNEHLEERLGGSLSGTPRAELDRLLGDRGFPSAIVQEILRELEGCDFARFASTPSGTAEMRETLRRARDLVRAIERVSLREAAA